MIVVVITVDIKASGTSTVVNNKAPTAPQSITVPLNIYGEKQQ